MNEIVAVIDDEPDIRDLVRTALEREGFRVRTYPDGASFLSSLAREAPAIAVLDLMLPDIDGFDVCRELRRSERGAAVGVVMLTARAEEAYRVAGLELGADDYLVKPFSTQELAARVRAVLRRTRGAVPRPSVLRVGGDIVIDRDALVVTVGEHRVELTAAEFRLLELLASRPGWVFSRERILDHLWGSDKTVTDRSVDVHIHNLRAKLGEAGGRIVNLRGMGYRLEP